MQVTVETKKGFKETEIGLLPEDWKVAKLGEILVEAYRYPTYYNITYVRNGVPEVRGELLEDGRITKDLAKFRFVSESTANKFPKVRLIEGDLVISVRGTMGKIGYVPKEIEGAVITANLMRLSPNRDIVDSHFLKWYLLSEDFRSRLNTLSPQTTIKTIQAPVLKSIPISLPPLIEQRKIAFVLAKIQQATRQQDQIIEATRNLKKSLMQRLFTEGIAHTEFKDSGIGRMPKSWKTACLGELAEIRKEAILPDKESEAVYVGLEHIEPCNLKLKKYGRPSDVKSSKFKFYRGDILYGKLRPYLDKVSLAESSGICSTDIMVIRATAEINASFIANRMHLKDFVNYSTSTMTGVNHPRTSWSAISKFKFGLPPLNEQEDIAHALTAVDRKVDAEEKRKLILQQLFKTMLNKLMTGEIRVKDLDLGVSDVN
jgi:type I restriction enzyme S subunit